MWLFKENYMLILETIGSLTREENLRSNLASGVAFLHFFLARVRIHCLKFDFAKQLMYMGVAYNLFQTGLPKYSTRRYGNKGTKIVFYFFFVI
jgi:hypothetical protein